MTRVVINNDTETDGGGGSVGVGGGGDTSALELLDAVPATPASGITPFMLRHLGYPKLHTIDADGIVQRYEPQWARRGRIGTIINPATLTPAWGSTGLTTFNEFVSSATFPALAATSYRTSVPRRQFTRASGTATLIAGFQETFGSGTFCVANGFQITFRCSFTTRLAGSWGGVGFTADLGGVPPFRDPAASANSILFGYTQAVGDATRPTLVATPSTDMEFILVDGSGTAAANRTRLVLPNTYDADAFYEITLSVQPGDTSIWCYVTSRIGTAAAVVICDEALSTNLPTATTFLAMFAGANTGSSTTNAAVFECADVVFGSAQ